MASIWNSAFIRSSSTTSDGLDFHDVAVWCLRDALEAAFNAGVEQGSKAKKSDKTNN